jgi:hypothetical protein
MLPLRTTIVSFSALHAVRAVVVNNELVVDVKLAAIIGGDGETIETLARDDQEARPTYSKVIFLAEPTPHFCGCWVVHTGHTPEFIWDSAFHEGYTFPLLEVEDFFYEALLQLTPRN